jgi:hypothetical protein
MKRQENANKRQRELKARKQETFSSAAKFKPLTAKGFKTSLSKQKGQYLLNIKTASQQLTIVPEKGAMIIEWKANNKILVSTKGGEQKIGHDRFYLPAGFTGGVNGTYQLEDQKVSNGKLNLVFRKDIKKDNLKGIVIYKTIQIPADKPNFSLNYRIVNNGNKAMTMGIWIANIFELSRWKYKPQLTIGHKLFSSADLWNTIYCHNGDKKIAAIERLLSRTKKQEINSGSATLSSSAGKIKVSTDASGLAGILIWAIEKQEMDTLEFLFTPELLKPGAEMQIQLDFSNI